MALSISLCESRLVSKDDPSPSTQKRRALSWGDMSGDMSQGAPWDMTESLSKLTQDMTDVPIRDIDTWVRRPVEERKMETKQKGKVPRPMNSFMLYRWAFTERIKRRSRRRSAQVISSIAGKSWHKETQDVREKYQRLAKIERDNHASAYPDYEFKPKSRKRPSVAEPAADLESCELFGDNNYDWFPTDGFEITTPSPINYPSLGSHAEDIQSNLVAPMGEGFQGDCSSGLLEFPSAVQYDLLCPEPIDFLPSIFSDGSYVDPQWQARLWPIFYSV